MIKILIADKLSPVAVEKLEKLGAEVEFNPDLKADDLPGVVGDREILVVRSTKITSQTIDAAQNLSLIIRAGAGVNTIDLEAASTHGVHVANCPGMNTAAVAELALGLIIACDRRIPNATIDLRDGKWRKKEYGKAKGLKDRTLGIVGLGSIGKALAKAAKGLGINVIGWSRSLTPELAEQQEIGYCLTPQELAEKSDIISVHLAATPETKHFINPGFLDKMKDGAILVNTSRGEIVDTEALKKAIAEKGLKVGLDVYENEPGSSDPEFGDTGLAATVMCTPHIGASTEQASEAIAQGVVDNVEHYLGTGKPLHPVNLRGKRSHINLVVRHYNRVGVLAGVLDVLKNVGINVEEMENTIFDGGHAASCNLILDKTPDGSSLKRIGDMDNIIQVMLK